MQAMRLKMKSYNFFFFLNENSSKKNLRLASITLLTDGCDASFPWQVHLAKSVSEKKAK